VRREGLPRGAATAEQRAVPFPPPGCPSASSLRADGEAADGGEDVAGDDVRGGRVGPRGVEDDAARLLALVENLLGGGVAGREWWER
jgi:hypothetical protein